jgi:hypothetical protein
MNTQRVTGLVAGLQAELGIRRNQIEIGEPSTNETFDRQGRSNGFATEQTVGVSATATRRGNAASARIVSFASEARFTDASQGQAFSSFSTPIATPRAVEGARARAEASALKDALARASLMGTALGKTGMRVTELSSGYESFPFPMERTFAALGRAAAPAPQPEFDVRSRVVTATKTVSVDLE